MNDRTAQVNKDIAGLVFSAYQRADDREEFRKILNGYQYLHDEKLSIEMLFVLCNAAHHAGYIEGLEENE